MKILILKPSSLGDIIASLPVAQSIRDQCPDAEISWVVKSRFADIVRRCPTVNGEIIQFEHAAGVKGLIALQKVIRGLRLRRFDAVLDFQGLLRTGLMTWAARAAWKIGSRAAREGSQFSYNRIVPLPVGGAETHAIDKLLQFLPAIGLRPELRSSVEIHGESIDPLDARLSGAAPVVILPNSRGEHKEWRSFPELTTRIVHEIPGTVVVWDSHLRWQDAPVSDPNRLINLTSRTTLLQLVELLRRARLVIANDSGPLHMAAALGRPTLGLFGPTSALRFGPYPPTASRNQVLTAPGGDLKQLTCDVVFRKVSQILASDTEQRNAA